MYFKWTIFSIIFLLRFTDAKYSGSRPPLEWWQKTILYQIYPRSFQDTNGDGIGDLKGITQRVSYFVSSGIGAVWISPVYKSPQRDLGYDISNYTEIDPSYGTMNDLMKLLKTFQSRGVKVLLDFVPNHTSDQHPWFEMSVKKIYPYTNYYVWKDPKGWINRYTPIPPNNWRSMLNDSAWHFNWERKQYYLGQFLKEQPELNFRYKYVVEELKNVLRFYLDKGVNGFRTDAAPFLVEDAELRDEPPVKVLAPGSNKTDYVNQQHIYTTNQPETYDILREFREVLDSYSEKGGPKRVLVVEAYAEPKVYIKYYGTILRSISQIPLNYDLEGKLDDSSDAKAFSDTINSILDNIPQGKWPNWGLGNHDNPRVPTRFESSAVDEMNILAQLLPGTAITYQGEEIGMEDTKLRPDQIVDQINPPRDPERTPFQWDNSLHAGFSNTKGNTWTPVNPNYYTLNLQAQKNDPKSHYSIYTSLAKLRLTDEFLYGDFESYIISEFVYTFTRSLTGKYTYIVVVNLNNEQEYVNLVKSISNLPGKSNVVIASGNSEHNPGDKISNAGFTMRPKSALVLNV